MKVLVRCSILHQPHDDHGLGQLRCAAVNQWIKSFTHAPGTDYGNGFVFGELQGKLALSLIGKDRMSVKREIIFQSLELLEELATF